MLSPMRPGTPAAACAAALLLAAAAAAGIITREDVESGDTILGDIRVPGAVDEYDFLAPRDATIVLDLRGAPPAGWRPAATLAADGIDLLVPFQGIGPTTVRSGALSTTGTWRLLVSSAGDTTGGYKLRLVVDPGRSFQASGAGDAQPGPLAFGAVPGTSLTATLRWKGVTPVTFGEVTGPGGAPLAAGTPKTKGRTTVVSGISTTAFGDHALSYAVPAGTKTWSVRVKAKPPRAPKGSVRDFRTEETPEPPAIDILNVGQLPYVTIRGERGGPNDILFLGGESPTAFVGDARRGNCILGAADPGEIPSSYRFACTAGFLADIADVVREAGRVRSFSAVVRTPSGSGTVEFAEIEYDAAGRPASWTESRTFDASGHVHQLAFSHLGRRTDGTIIAYTVVHTAPGLEPRTYDYAPLRTR